MQLKETDGRYNCQMKIETNSVYNTRCN